MMPDAESLDRGGIVLIDKPRGKTSHDIVAELRRRLGVRRVGHAGTLDPMATGVLVVAVGQATKLVDALSGQEKEYEATVALGVETDTLDAEGTILRAVPLPEGWQKRLPEAIERERERTTQVPPSYSAIHVKGRRAHELARAGESFTLPPRAISVKRIEIGETRNRRVEEPSEPNPPSAPVEIAFTLLVSKGYYVRSFARDLAHELGTVGHLSSLRRTRSGTFSIAQAIAPELIFGITLPLDAMARSLFPSVDIPPEMARDLLMGKTLVSPNEANVPLAEEFGFFSAGQFVGIGEAIAPLEGATTVAVRLRRGFPMNRA